MPAEADYTITIGKSAFSQNPTGNIPPGKTILFALADDRTTPATVDVLGLFCNISFVVSNSTGESYKVHPDAASKTFTIRANKASAAGRSHGTGGPVDTMTGTINVGSGSLSGDGHDDRDEGRHG